MTRKYGQPAPRFIYPETIRSEQIRELAKNKDHLLLFYCLFHGVDDQGRMEARVSTIQALCLGHLPENAIKPRVVQEALKRMCDIKDSNGVPLIYIYPANGTMVLQIAGWWEHQGGMRNAWPSRWDAMPGWVDDVRGHGRRALDEIIAERGDDGGTDVAPASSNSSAPNHNRNQKTPNGVMPWDLFEAYLGVLGIEAKDFPSPRIQLRHAKLMLADGWTPEKVKEAAEAFCADPFWSTKGFDLASINAHWGKLKMKGTAKRPSRPMRTLKDIQEPDPL